MKRFFDLSLQELFETLGESHPVIVLKDVKAKHLEMLLEYVYCGRVDCPQSEIKEFKSVAESMKIPFESEGKESAIENDFDSLPEIMSQEQFEPTALALDQTMTAAELLTEDFEGMIEEAQQQFILITDEDETEVTKEAATATKEAPRVEEESQKLSRFFFKNKCDVCWNKVEAGGKARYLKSIASIRTHKTMLKCSLCRIIFTRQLYYGPYHPKLRPAAVQTISN
jgi:BTB/POZ domain